VLLKPNEITLELDLFYSNRSQQGFIVGPSADGTFQSVLPTEQEQDTFTSVYTARTGLLSRSQAFVTFSLLHQTTTLAPLGPLGQEDHSTRLETGDLIFGVRHTLLQERLYIPEFIFSLQGQVPTDNDRPYGIGGSLFMLKSIDPVVLFGSIGYTRQFSSATHLEPQHRLNVSLGYALGLNDKLSIRTSVAGNFSFKSEFTVDTEMGPTDLELRSREQFSLQFALTMFVTKGLYIEPAVSFDLNEPGNSVTFGLSLPYTFGL
jgi:hypothetical protein